MIEYFVFTCANVVIVSCAFAFNVMVFGLLSFVAYGPQEFLCIGCVWARSIQNISLTELLFLHLHGLRIKQL